MEKTIPETKIRIPAELRLPLAFALATIAVHLAANAWLSYGIFRDEFYYLACSHRLALGYVDQPPLSIYLLALGRSIFGDSLFAIRLLPALVSGLTVLVSGRLIHRLGGGRTAMILGLLAVALAPFALGQGSYHSMNCFDGLFWILAACTLAAIIDDGRPRQWLQLGLIIGLGLLNKIGVSWLALGIFAGLLLTEQRRHLKSKWPYLAALLALLIFSPYIIWNIQNHFAHLEFIRNATQMKYGGLTRADFLIGQFKFTNPLAAPIWLAGLYFFLFSRRGGRFRPLGMIYLTAFAILFVNGHSKDEYLQWAYPMLFAGGAVQIEAACASHRRRWLAWAAGAGVLGGGLLIAPMAMPLLPVRTYIGYTRALGMVPRSPEGHRMSELPQHYADMFGWQEMAQTVAAVYASLPAEEKASTLIYARNYGEAGALEYYRRTYDLPPVVSPHNNYWIWGQHHFGTPWRTLIILGGRIEGHLHSLETVAAVALFRCRYCMPYENDKTIYVGRGFKRSLAEIWSTDRFFD